MSTQRRATERGERGSCSVLLRASQEVFRERVFSGEEQSGAA